MRTLVLGAFGTAVIYASVWFGDAPIDSGPGAQNPPTLRAAESAVQPPVALSPRIAPKKRRKAKPTVAEQNPVDAISDGAAPVARAEAASPAPRGVGQAYGGALNPHLAPTPLAESNLDNMNKAQSAVLPPHVQAALSETNGIQDIAANPHELEMRLRGIKADPRKIRELKAFAEMFVELPEGLGSSLKAQSPHLKASQRR